MRDRTNEKWTEAQKEWMGYKRRMSTLDKENVTLAQPPWEKETEEKDHNG